jgi:hypothetical protein
VYIHSECYEQTLTAETTSDGSYNVATTALVQDLTAFDLSTGVCTTVTYTITDGSGNAIDSSIFTFDASALTLTTSTSSAADIGTYDFILTGSLTGDVQTASTTFSVVIHNQCYGSTFTAVTTSDGSYNIESTTLIMTLSAFTLVSADCSTIAYTISSSPTFDSSVFTFTASSRTLAVYTTSAAKEGTYTFTLTGTLVDNVVTTSTTFDVVIHTKCYG